MLTIPKTTSPILNVSAIGTAVFAVGFIGSFALLNYYQPGMSGGSAANVVTTPEQNESEELGVKQSERKASSNKDSKTMGSKRADWQPNTFLQSATTQPQPQYSQPAQERTTIQQAGVQPTQTLQPTVQPSPETSTTVTQTKPTKVNDSVRKDEASLDSVVIDPVTDTVTSVIDPVTGLLR